MSTFNGHPSWEHWNVSLWLHNDEGLYNMARSIWSKARGDARTAAIEMQTALADCGETQTPDGARYSQRVLTHIFTNWES